MVTPEQKSDSSSENPAAKSGQQEVYLENANIDSIHGDTVHVSRSSVNHIVAEEIDLEGSSAQFVDSQTITAQKSNIGNAHAESISIENGETGLIYGDQVNAGGNLGAVFANAVAMNQGQSGIIVAKEMHGDKIQSVILIAGKVNGPIETKLDMRNALMLGAVAGACLGIVISLLRLMTRK